MKHMKLRIAYLAVAVLALCAAPAPAQLVPNLGGQRAGISGLQFLKIGVGARGSAMGESFVAVANDISALYWNPAGITQVEQSGVIVCHAEYLVDLKHDFAGVLYKLDGANVVGLSITSLSTDDMAVTTETQPGGTGMYFSYGDLALSLSYGRQMTEQFSFGASVKYVQETMDMLKIRTVLFDLGTFYKIGLGTTRFSVVVANFGSDISPTGTATLLDGSTMKKFQTFSPPTVFKLGIAFEPYEDELHRVTTSVQLNHPNDNAEQLRIGAEYAFQKWLMARVGVKRTIGEPIFGRDGKSAEDISAGVGVVVPIAVTTASFDYGLSSYGQLGLVHRISLSMTF